MRRPAVLATRPVGPARASLVLACTVALAGAPAAAQSPAPDETTAPGLDFGATTLAFEDSFDETGLWGTADEEDYRISQVNGALEIEQRIVDGAAWGWRTLDAAHPVLAIEGYVELSPGDGVGGYLCGANTEDGTREFILGAVTGRDEWVVATIRNAFTKVMARGRVPAEVADGGPHVVLLECALTEGADGRARISVDDVAVAEFVIPDAIGPFDKVGAYGGRGAEPSIVTLDDVTAFVGDTPLPVAGGPAPGSAPDVLPPPALSAEEEELRSHIPAAFVDSCSTVEIAPEKDELAGFICSPAGDADQAEYYLYETTAAMDKAFEAAVPDSLKARDCRRGPSVGPFSVGDVKAGRLACFKNAGSLGGILFAWTNRQLRILSFGVDAEGVYPDLYDGWV
jgi:hypothetical protein